MKRNIIITTIAIFATTSAVCILVLCLFNKTKDEELYSLLENIRIENILLKEGFFHSYDYENLSIDYGKSIYNYKGDSTNISQISNSDPTLFLLIDHGGCSDCYLANIEAIKDFHKRKNINIVVGILGLDKRSFRAFVINNNIESFCYLLPNNFFEGFRINSIIYFVLNDSKASSFYSPSKVLPELTEDYFFKLQDLFGF